MELVKDNPTEIGATEEQPKKMSAAEQWQALKNYKDRLNEDIKLLTIEVEYLRLKKEKVELESFFAVLMKEATPETPTETPARNVSENQPQ